MKRNLPPFPVASPGISLAYRRWLNLYSSPECWTNPELKKRMLQARLEYQDAVVESASNRTTLSLIEFTYGAGDKGRVA
jgi:hypothetical protein